MSNSDADYSNLSDTRDPVRFRRIPGRYRVNLLTRNGNRTHTHAFDARTLVQLRPDPRNPSQTLHPLTREPISRENLNRARRLAPGHAPPHNAHDTLARLSPSASGSSSDSDVRYADETIYNAEMVQHELNELYSQAAETASARITTAIRNLRRWVIRHTPFRTYEHRSEYDSRLQSLENAVERGQMVVERATTSRSPSPAPRAASRSRSPAPRRFTRSGRHY
jgi:3-methyladenine DNA glycosylase AlkC